MFKPYAILACFALFFFVSVGYLWGTSSVYRASLPEIVPPSLSPWDISVRLLLIGSASYGAQCGVLSNFLLSKLDSKQFQFSVSCHHFAEPVNPVPPSEMDDALQAYLVTQAANLPAPSSTLTFFLLETKDDTSTSARWWMGSHRHGWCHASNTSLALQSLPKLIQNLILPQAALAHEPLKVPSLSAYTLSFTLLNARPTEVRYSWDIEACIDRFISPFAAKLQSAFELASDSQVLYFAELSHEVKYDKQKDVYSITPATLSEFVGNTKWNVVSPLSSNSIELLVYIPPAGLRPLLINQGNSIFSASFVVPRWGGVFLLNQLPNSTGTPEVRISADELASAMGAFVSQLRIMFGLTANEQEIKLSGVTLMSSSQGITDWELDALLRSRLITYLGETTDTLKSLYELLAAQSHMPVDDIIKYSVQQALEERDRAIALAVTGEYSVGMASARTALAAAKSAFFHPSLMPLLYFPDEHLYAVYAPFFLPIFIPVVSALISIYKQRRKKAKRD